MMRQRLPLRRESRLFRLGYPFEDFTVGVSRFEGGAPAEVFIDSRFPTSGQANVARDGAVLISIALQYGVPLEALRGAITRLSDESAATVIGAALDLLDAQFDSEGLA